jgi:hypothetical protein
MSKHDPKSATPALTTHQKERFLSTCTNTRNSNSNHDDLMEWRNVIKPSLRYSTVNCFVCKERLYYGLYYNVETNKRPVFKCKCPDKGLIFEDKCAMCKTPVGWKSDKERAVMLRCTCGHAGILTISKESSTMSF